MAADSQKLNRNIPIFAAILIQARKKLVFFLCFIVVILIVIYYRPHTAYRYITIKPNEASLIISTNPSSRDIIEDYTNFYRWDSMHGRNAINKNVTKVILFYDKYWMSGGFGIGTDHFKGCPVNTCLIVDNHTYKGMEEYDAIIFHAETWSAKKYGFPTKRNTWQKYIFFAWESPYHTYFNETFYKDHKYYYNWTMNFRRDSDIHLPYGVIHKEKTNYVMPEPADLKNKTIMAAWLVSNNFTEGTVRRKDYVKELQKYVQVDVYGHAGNMTCKNCYEEFEQKYFFYISFENSMCKDYVTEKMFNPMRYNIVPIVLGFSDYKSIVPSHSIIDTNDFPSPKLLADYLKRLTNNLDLYLEYFQWKKDYVSLTPKHYGFCQLCIKLHEPITYSSYEDIKTWYFGFNKCYR